MPVPPNLWEGLRGGLVLGRKQTEEQLRWREWEGMREAREKARRLMELRAEASRLKGMLPKRLLSF